MKEKILILILITQFSFAQKVHFNILQEKTKVDNIGAITLYVEVINKSNNSVKILKPATDYKQKWRYYNCNLIKCDDIPIWDGGSGNDKLYPYEDSDLLIIPAKSKIIISINGRYNTNMLACYSKIIELQLLYNTTDLLKELNSQNLNLEEMVVLKKLTPLKIESKIVKINLQ